MYYNHAEMCLPEQRIAHFSHNFCEILGHTFTHADTPFNISKKVDWSYFCIFLRGCQILNTVWIQVFTFLNNNNDNNIYIAQIGNASKRFRKEEKDR